MFQYSAKQVGLFMSYIGVLITIGLVFIMRILLRFLKIYWLIWFALTIIILGILYMLSFQGEWSYIIGAIPISLGIGICYTALITRLSNAVEEEFQGWAMGIGMAITAFAWFSGAVIIGFTTPIHEKLPLILCGVFTFISLAISLLRKP
jgi:predicted MFS family arabinose efflux permease